MSRFRAIFEDLTGNEFNPFVPFVKQPEKYQWLKIEYDAHEDVLNSLVPTALNDSNHKLMEVICDERAMQNIMLKFDLDSVNMPLGKAKSISIFLCHSIH